jgi:hypothetical protein
MTFAETLNDEACSCGLEEGQTWFNDGNGNEPDKVGEYQLLKNNHGIRVEAEDGGFLVFGLDESGNEHVAGFNTKLDYLWSDH